MRSRKRSRKRGGCWSSGLFSDDAEVFCGLHGRRSEKLHTEVSTVEMSGGLNVLPPTTELFVAWQSPKSEFRITNLNMGLR